MDQLQIYKLFVYIIIYAAILPYIYIYNFVKLYDSHVYVHFSYFGNLLVEFLQNIF